MTAPKASDVRTQTAAALRAVAVLACQAAERVEAGDSAREVVREFTRRAADLLNGSGVVSDLVRETVRDITDSLVKRIKVEPGMRTAPLPPVAPPKEPKA